MDHNIQYMHLYGHGENRWTETLTVQSHTTEQIIVFGSDSRGH